jgi:hypothetical protein
MTITFPAGTKNIIDQIRLAIGREVDFYTETSVPCSGCGIDPVTKTSINPFCNICGGTGYIYNFIITTISAHITWGGLDTLNWQSGGQIFEGDAGIQIEYTNDNLITVNGCKYVLVDGKKMTIRRKILRGVQPINRILLDLEEEEV